MKFLPTEVDEGAGYDAEMKIWESLKNALGPDEKGIAYHRYPIVDNTGEKLDREPDFVILHKDWGLILIECKGYQIHHINKIEGSTWYLQGTSQNKAAPYSQVKDQGHLLHSRFTSEGELMREGGMHAVSMNVFVALPNITQKEWDGRGFDGPAEPRKILEDDLTPKSLREKLSNVKTFGTLSNDEFNKAKSVLSCGHPISNRGTVSPRQDSKGEIFEGVEKGLKELDEKQQEIGIQIPPGPQQVRGIAGSGKTVLIAMKAARMHQRHPDWDIALTFNTRSLYPQIQSLVERFYNLFANDEPDFEKLRIIHGWGGRNSGDGMYYLASRNSSVNFRTVNSAKNEFDEMAPNKLLDECCKEVVEAGDIPQMFDAILIDEAQDFEKNFYKMCYEALDPNTRRLIWAYDEAQNLTSLTAPSPKNIFGTDEEGEPIVDLSGSYQRGIQKSQIMRRSYRAPKEILMTAHVFGMGLKRNPPVQAITEKEGWRNIGYEVEGDFRRYGEEIRIVRPDQNSPHPMQEIEKGKPFVRFEAHSGKWEEVEWIANQIETDIQEEDLNPEQILVIPLGGKHRGHGHMIEEKLEESSIDSNCVWEGDKSVFSEENKVTISGINRAKGNEAAMVYLMSLEEVENDERRAGPVKRRNEAFVGVTRSRGWCTITGCKSGNGAFRELEEVLNEVTQPESTVTFPAPNPDDLIHVLESDRQEKLSTFD